MAFNGSQLIAPNNCSTTANCSSSQSSPVNGTNNVDLMASNTTTAAYVQVSKGLPAANLSVLWIVAADSSHAAVSTSGPAYTGFTLPQIANMPQVVFFGLVGCFGLLVMLTVSLICHHIRVHISLLKDLERSGYQPDESWKRSPLHRLSVMVRKHDERRATSRSVSRASSQGLQSNDSLNDNEGAEANRGGIYSGGRRSAFSDRSTSSSAYYRSPTPDSSSTSTASPNSIPLTTISGLLLTTIQPSLVLTSIAEEYDSNGLLNSLPEISHRSSVARVIPSLQDPDHVRRSLTLDLLELHQKLREIEDGEGDDVDNICNEMDEELKTLYDLPIGSTSPVSLELPFIQITRPSQPSSSQPFFSPTAPLGSSEIMKKATIFSFDEDDLKELQVTATSSPGPSEDDAPLLLRQLPLPSPPPAPAITSPSTPSTSATGSTRSVPVRVPSHANLRPSHLTLQQQQNRGLVASSSSSNSLTANSILMNFARRIGDTYYTDLY